MGCFAGIEQLVAAQLSGSPPDPETSRWLASCGDKLVAKLADVGLSRERRSATLGAYIDAWNADPKVKASTLAASQATHKHLRKFFGEAKPLRDITPGDADRWRIDAAEGRAENTVRKWFANAKKLFNAAIADELIEKNPFAGIPSQPVENRERDYFVTAGEAAKVLTACPSIDWRRSLA